MDPHSNEPILETVRLQKQYVRILEVENERWNDLNVRWIAIVNEWKRRQSHSQIEEKLFNEQRGVVHSIINEYSELLFHENEIKSDRLQVLKALVEKGEIYSVESNREIQNAIRDDIDYEMMRRRMIADRLERALDDLAEISSQIQ